MKFYNLNRVIAASRTHIQLMFEKVKNWVSRFHSRKLLL
jgi:hypothetical protein